MRYNRLGQSGLKISQFSFGTWLNMKDDPAGEKTARDLLIRAYDAGINSFDTADWYGHGESERVMGHILKIFPRHTLVIASKTYLPMSDDINDRGLSRKHVMESAEKSLRRLGTDYIDIYYAHRYDEDTPLLETMRAMDDLIRQGKILYWGTSKWRSEWIRDALDMAEEYHLNAPVVEQANYSLLIRDYLEEEIVPFVKDTGYGLVTYSPLTGGLLTGKYDDGVPEGTRFSEIGWVKERYFNDESVRRTKALRSIADDLGVSRAELAIAWCLHNQSVQSVILGATKLSQLESNLKAAEITLTDDVLAAIDEIFPCEPWPFDTMPGAKNARRSLS